MEDRQWSGKAVVVKPKRTATDRPIGMALSLGAARELAEYLRKSSGLQSIFNPLPAQLTELLNALDYVLVGDPASLAAHRRMEAGKGMTPDGGYKSPEDKEDK